MLDYIGEEMTGPLATPVEDAAGDGSTDGSTRKLVVDTETADQFSPGNARQDIRACLVLAKKGQVDNFFCYPSKEPTTVFSEGMAMVLCAPVAWIG